MKPQFSPFSRNIHVRKVLMLWSVLLVLIVIASSLFYFYERNNALERLQGEVREISSMKAQQFSAWHAERLADLEMFSQSPFFISAISEWIGNKEDINLKERIERRLELINTTGTYDNIMIINAEGQVIVSLKHHATHALESATNEHFQLSLKRDTSFVTDFYWCEHHQKLHLDYIAPIKDGQENITAGIIFRVDMQHSIKPILKSQVAHLEKTHNYILRVEDGQIHLVNVFNEELTIALESITLNEEEEEFGFGKAYDFNNQPLYSYTVPIDGTNWLFLIVSYVDEADAFLRAVPVRLILVSIALVLILSFALFIYYHNLRRSVYLHIFNEEKKISHYYKIFHTILSSLEDGVIVLSTQGTVIRTNEAAERMIGLTEEQVQGKDLSQLIPNARELLQAVDVVLKEGERKHIEFAFTKDENRISTQTNIAPIVDNEGVLQGVSIILSDKTKEISANQKLLDSEKRYKMLFNNMTQGFALHRIVVDSQGKPVDYVFLDVNRAFEEILQLKKEDIIGKTVREVLPKIETSWIETYGKVAIEGVAIRFEEYAQELDKYFGVSAFSPQPEQFAVVVSDITKRKKAEEAERQRNEFIETIMDNLPVGVMLTTMKTDKVNYANKAFEEIYGWKFEELETSKNFLKKVFNGSEEHWESFASFEQQTFAGKNQLKRWNDLKIKTKAGEEKIVNTAVIPLVSQGIVASVIVDVTQSKQVEYSLRESEELFSNLFYDNSSIMFITHAETMRLVDVNNEALRFYGWTREEMLEMHIDDINTLTFEEVIENITDTTTNVSQKFNFKHRTKNRGIRDVEAYTCIIKRGGQRLIHSIIRDVTETKRAEEQVLRLSMAMEHSPASVVITNIEGIIEYVNPKFEEITGYASEEVIGRDLSFLHTTSSTDLAYSELWETIQSGKDWRIEALNRRKNGELYWESTLVSPIISDDGEIKNFVAIKEDITLRKQAEIEIENRDQRLKEQNEEYVAVNEELTERNQKIRDINEELINAREKAEENDRLKSAFLANMSHEIRTPMNAIVGFSELLLNQKTSEEKKNKFSRILNTACHQLLNVVEDIIDISKIETGQMDFYESPTSINETIKKIYEIFEPQAQVNNVDFRYKLPLSDSESEILTDSTKLNQILTNLISNAIKFTEKGFVEVGYALKDEMVEIYVQDTGLGIEPENHTSIFERFRQVELGETRKYGGTGLGLPISKSFVYMMGGDIWIESALGKGSTFYFTIPYKSTADKTEAIEAKQSYDYSSLNILVAEDEDANFTLIKEILSETKATVWRANNGLEAVDEALANPHFDLIIMDVKMPVLSGVEATRIIRTHNARVPILALTAFALSGDKEDCLKAGCNEYLSKPIRREELFNKISKLLRHKEN